MRLHAFGNIRTWFANFGNIGQKNNCFANVCKLLDRFLKSYACKNVKITDTLCDSPPSKNEISFSREARRKFLTFCAEGAEKIFLRALLFLVQEAATHTGALTSAGA